MTAPQDVLGAPAGGGGATGPRTVGPAFAAAREERRAALVGYLPAGFPTVTGAVDALLAMVDAGVDVVEVGFPYSDPVMDGPVIQAAADAALAAGARPADVLATVGAVADRGVPALVMSYWNPVVRYGVDAFARDLAAAGGAGLITPDLLPEEAADWLAASDTRGLDRVFLVAPASTPARVAHVAAHSRGFVYAASTMGVTGARGSVGERAAGVVAAVRAATDLPVAVGLGVSSGSQAAEVAAYADGVIVGSAFVSCLADAGSVREGVRAVGTLAEDLADGVRHPRST